MIVLQTEHAMHILRYLEGRPMREVEAGVVWLRAAIKAAGAGVSEKSPDIDPRTGGSPLDAQGQPVLVP